MRLGIVALLLVLAGCGGETPSPQPSASESLATFLEGVRWSGGMRLGPGLWLATGSTQDMVPEAFRGVWSASVKGCHQPDVAGLSIAADTLAFPDVTVAVEGASPGGDGAFLISGKGHAPGREFEANVALRTGDDGGSLVLGDGDNARVFVRCGDAR